MHDPNTSAYKNVKQLGTPDKNKRAHFYFTNKIKCNTMYAPMDSMHSACGTHKQLKQPESFSLPPP